MIKYIAIIALCLCIGLGGIITGLVWKRRLDYSDLKVTIIVAPNKDVVAVTVNGNIIEDAELLNLQEVIKDANNKV